MSNKATVKCPNCGHSFSAESAIEQEVRNHLQKEFQEKINFTNIEPITDDKPVLELLNAQAAKRWRYYYLQNFIKNKY